MKKLLFTLIALVLAAGLQAQHLAPSKVLDNWYVGGSLGLNSKVTNNDFMTNVNPSASLRVGRDFNPYVGLMFEGTAFFHDKRFGYSETVVKAMNYDLLVSVNLSNLISGFKGTQRFFETRVLAGVGFNHIYGLDTQNNNDLISKIGVDLVFHHSSLDALEFYLSPAINFNLDHYSQRTQFNFNYSAWQLSAGVNYRFKNSNGTRYFALADGSEISRMNQQTNKLREQSSRQTEEAKQLKADEQAADKEAKAQEKEERKALKEQEKAAKKEAKAQKKAAKQQAKEAKKQSKSAGKKEYDQALAAAQAAAKRQQTGTTPEESGSLTPVQPQTNQPVVSNQPVATEQPKVNEQPEKSNVNGQPQVTTQPQPATAAVTAPVDGELPSIAFAAGSSHVDASQSARLAQVAAYLRNHPRAVLILQGSAARINAVRTQLQRSYGVRADRLQAEPREGTSTVAFKVK